jgi:hypothetical protein
MTLHKEAVLGRHRSPGPPGRRYDISARWCEAVYGHSQDIDTTTLPPAKNREENFFSENPV